MAFEAALKHLVEADPDKEQLIRSTVKPGAGSGTQSVKGKAGDNEPKQMSSLERISLGLKKLQAEQGGVAK
jgi:hypothetical protein